MSTDYFSKFMQQSRLKVDYELAKRWEFDAHYHGDNNIKTQMATARRTATVLEKSINQFSNMRPEQELSIKAAASSMRTLAGEREGLAAWAKAYHLFCKAEHKKESAVALAAIADKRWGGDAEALAFELGIIQELTSKDGREALGKWMRDHNKFLQIASDCFYSPFSPGSLKSLDSSPRAEAAAQVEEGMKSGRERRISWDGKHLHCSWQDYENYLIYRKEVAKTTARVMQMTVQD